jgi:hypothetical protein
MKSLKKMNNYNVLILQFVKTQSNDKFFLLKVLHKAINLQRQGSFILKTLPYIYNLSSVLGVYSVSNCGLNYVYILRYLYCFGANASKGF